MTSTNLLRSRDRRTRAALLVPAVCFAAALGAPTLAHGDVPAIPAADWQRYVQGPATRNVRPTVVSTEGVTSGAAAIRSGGTLTATVTPDRPVSVILDYGDVIGGTPYFNVTYTSGEQPIELTTYHSESRRFLNVSSPMTAATEAGADTITLTSATDIAAGDRLVVDAGTTEERATVASVDNATGRVALTGPLEHAHPSGTIVADEDRFASDDLGGLGAGPMTTTEQITGPGRLTSNFRGGYRYQAVTITGNGTVVLGLGTNLVGHHATADDYEGWFASDDDTLNRVWYSGAYTNVVDLVPAGVDPRYPDANMINDGAKRDRAIWSGDLVHQDPSLLASLGRSARPYIEDSLGLMLGSKVLPETPENAGLFPGAFNFVYGITFGYGTTYSMLNVLNLDDYYAWSGDAALVRRFLPQIRTQLEAVQRRTNADGLIASVDDPDFDQVAKTGVIARYNMVYREMLKRIAHLERRVGDPARAADAERAAETVGRAILRTLQDPATGLFGRSIDQRGTIPQDANALAVSTGLVQGDVATRILSYLRSTWKTMPNGYFGVPLFTGQQPTPAGQDARVHPYAIQMEVEARLRAGDTTSALDLVRHEFGQMVKPGPFNSGGMWEFQARDTGVPNDSRTSLAHGWASAPTHLLSTYVLGVSPTTPGYASWRVAPQLGDLRWAQGRVPTPSGAIGVRWARTPGSALRLRVQPVEGQTGEVAVPLQGAERDIRLNGDVVWRAGRPAPGVDATRDGDAVVFRGVGREAEFTYDGVAAPSEPTPAPTPTPTPAPTPAPATGTGPKRLTMDRLGTIRATTLTRRGVLVRVTSPVRGRVAVSLRRGTRSLGDASRVVARPGTYRLRVRLSVAGRKQVRALRRGRTLALQVRVRVRVDGRARVVTRVLEVRG